MDSNIKSVDNFLAKYGVKLYETATDYAVSEKEIFKLLKIIKSEKKVILGGEIWEKKNSSFLPTYDSWYSEVEVCTPEKSFLKTIDYIQRYPLNKNNYILLVFQ